MKKLALGLCLIAALALGACSQQSAQSALEPKISTCNPLSSTLQFYAGTANVAGTVGLNTVVTLRQNAAANCTAGASLLDNAPTITGPAGFTVPATADAGNDAGTGHISATLVTSLIAAPPASTFDNTAPTYSAFNAPLYGLASGYGFLPAVQTSSLAAPNYLPWPLPFYAGAGAQLDYIGGPPAFVPPADSAGTHTSTRDGTFPSGYLGFVLGFTDYQAPPVAGSYGLSVVIPTGQNTQTGASSSGTETATSSLTHVAQTVAAWAAGPTFVSDGNGGGTITTNFTNTGTAAATEEYIEVVDLGPSGDILGAAACLQYPIANNCAGTEATANGPVTNTMFSTCTTAPLSVSYPIYYTFKVTPGATTVTVPDNIGPAQPGKAQGHTFCTAADNTAGLGAANPGDGIALFGFAVDYSLYSTAYPQSNGNPAPTFTLTNGQADISTSPATTTGVE